MISSDIILPQRAALHDVKSVLLELLIWISPPVYGKKISKVLFSASYLGIYLKAFTDWTFTCRPLQHQIHSLLSQFGTLNFHGTCVKRGAGGTCHYLTHNINMACSVSACYNGIDQILISYPGLNSALILLPLYKFFALRGFTRFSDFPLTKNQDLICSVSWFDLHSPHFTEHRYCFNNHLLLLFNN